MRAFEVRRCPKCGGEMRVLDGRERTVPGGAWYELMCPACLHRADMFKPRRGEGPWRQ